MFTDRQLVPLVLAAAMVAFVTMVMSVNANPLDAKAGAPLVFTGLVKNTAVGGYDPVAYFTDGKPVQGRAEITLDHLGATWRFASATNRDAFKADPAKYGPQYGGHCAWAVANGYTAKGDPQAWTIAGGKLYLNYSKSVQKAWEKDIAGNVLKGDAKWPKLAGG